MLTKQPLLTFVPGRRHVPGRPAYTVCPPPYSPPPGGGTVGGGGGTNCRTVCAPARSDGIELGGVVGGTVCTTVCT